MIIPSLETMGTAVITYTPPPPRNNNVAMMVANPTPTIHPPSGATPWQTWSTIVRFFQAEAFVLAKAAFATVYGAGGHYLGEELLSELLSPYIDTYDELAVVCAHLPPLDEFVLVVALCVIAWVVYHSNATSNGVRNGFEVLREERDDAIQRCRKLEDTIDVLKAELGSTVCQATITLGTLLRVFAEHVVGLPPSEDVEPAMHERLVTFLENAKNEKAAQRQTKEQERKRSKVLLANRRSSLKWAWLLMNISKAKLLQKQQTGTLVEQLKHISGKIRHTLEFAHAKCAD